MLEGNVSPIGNDPVNSQQPSEQVAFTANPDEAVTKQVRDQDDVEVADPKTVTRRFKVSDVSLRFEMDEETQELTVYLLDNEKKEVIRTIPPGQVKNTAFLFKELFRPSPILTISFS